MAAELWVFENILRLADLVADLEHLLGRFAKLAELEKKHFEGMEGNFDELLKRFKKMGGSLQKEKLTKDLGASLKRADLKQAKREMEKLAKHLADAKDPKHAREVLDEVFRALLNSKESLFNH